MIGQCEVCGQWHTGEHPITVMTPTTSDREALIAAAEEIEYGHAWISREAASTIIYKHADALTREQREGVECRNPCTPCDFFNARACEKCVAERYSPPFGQPQQEAQGAVAWMTPESIAHLAKQNGVAKVDAWNCASGAERVPVFTPAPTPVDARGLRSLAQRMEGYVADSVAQIEVPPARIRGWAAELLSMLGGL